MWRPWKISLKSSKALDLYLVTQSHFRLRKRYNSVREEVDGLGPLNLTEHEFASGIANRTVKESKHEALNRKLRAISGQIDRATHSVDALEKGLCIETRWKQDDAEYVKMLEYIDNRKFVRVVEELQGLVVSRLVELDKMNLAGSGTE